MDYANAQNYTSTENFTGTLLSPRLSMQDEEIYSPKGDNDEAGRLIEDEDRAVGRVSKKVVIAYFKAIGGWSVVLAIVMLTIAMQVLKIASDLWLTRWSNESNNEPFTTFTQNSGMNMAVYALLALSSCFLVGIQTLSIVSYGIRGSQNMFSAMLINILQAPMRFFDTNPIGRILNRFSADVTLCDMTLPMSISPMLTESSTLLFTLGTAMVMLQWLGFFVLPLLYIYYRLGSYFLEPLREVNRIQQTSISPMISFISESIDGASTIRAFGREQSYRFERLNHIKIDDYTRARLTSCAINVWFSMRMQLISSTIVAVILLALVALHDELSPGIIGLLISYGLSVPSNFTYLVAIWANIETYMISPERIQEYARVEKEGIRESIEPSSWPATGKLEFQNVSFRYKPNDPLVLNNINFTVQGGEKI
ncbi:ATP-binding Cassette (ABC) Superfamily, partial [Thraustotheca clavata]